MADTTEQKVYTQEEFEKILASQREEVRKEAINALVAKNAELKSDLMQQGADEFYDISKWEIMNRMASDMFKSGALPKGDNAYTIMMKMQAGREMGLKPIESIKAFYIVNGVLNIFGDAVIRRLREHGWTLLPYKETPNSCTATIKKGDEEFSETFTYEEAKKSGWTESFGKIKPGWLEGINRKRKLRYGAMSTLIKTYVPEVLGSAVDIAEVAEDTVPLYQGKQSLDLPTPKAIEEKKAKKTEIITPDEIGKKMGEVMNKAVNQTVAAQPADAEQVKMSTNLSNRDRKAELLSNFEEVKA